MTYEQRLVAIEQALKELKQALSDLTKVVLADREFILSRLPKERV